jgi:transposase-like protein
VHPTDYLFETHIIVKPEVCEHCSHGIQYYSNKKIFQCKNYKCRKNKSIFKDTIFYDMKLPINKALHLTYEFIKKTPRSISASLGISKQTITEYYKIFRKIMKNRNSYLKKIGGKNDIVEIDESKSCKRKYNKGHQVKGTWIVGGISRKTKKVFMIPVKVRDAEKLTSIIKKHVLPGTTVYTDCWKGYNKLKLHNYIHKTVNHSNFFKDPRTGVHTNTIEGTWNGIKMGLPARNRTENGMIHHLIEYQWRKDRITYIRLEYNNYIYIWKCYILTFLYIVIFFIHCLYIC